MPISTITIGTQTIQVVALPAAPGLRSIDWDYSDAVAGVSSVFTGQKQRQQWPGADRLSGVAHLPPLTIAQADDWEAFQMQLRGIANAFQMGDPLRLKPRGSGAGAPIVDNTQPGGNAAGSQTLATKGWTANAVNVLRRGDWLQMGYRLYRALDDMSADSAGNAMIPIWPSLREQPPNNGSSARWLNASGSATKTSSITLGDYNSGVIWSNFQLPQSTPLPSDAVIQGIYPVLIASGNYDICFQYLRYGNVSFALSSLNGTGFTQPSGSPPISGAGSFASTEFYATASIGSSLAALTGQSIGMCISSSLLQSPITDSMNATGVGFAIYYTSAAPVTDPLMPPPFAVPGGQGLAWALPSVTATTPTDSNIQSSASPAIDNGGLVLNGARGLFSLGSNKRTSSADITQLSRTSFQFEEYR